MTSIARSLRRRVRAAPARFATAETGSVTVEAVLWIPLFLLLLILVADAALIFNSKSRILRVVQDANRSLSTGRLADESAAEAYITDALAAMTDNVTAETTIDAGVINSIVTVPAADLDVIGSFAALASTDVTVTAQHLVEY